MAGVFRSGQKKTARLAGTGGFSGPVGMRLAVPFRQQARGKEEKAVKPAVHRIDLVAH
jgi:hypothetical protein